MKHSHRVGADIAVLREREVDYDSDPPRKIAEVLIRKVPDDQQVSLMCHGDVLQFISEYLSIA